MARRLALGVAACVALSVMAASSAPSVAQGRPYLPQSLARHETRFYAREDCGTDPECVAYGVGACSRRSSSSVDCVEATFFLDRYGEQECDIVLHWGVSRGFVALKGSGPPYCYYVA